MWARNVRTYYFISRRLQMATQTIKIFMVTLVRCDKYTLKWHRNRMSSFVKMSSAIDRSMPRLPLQPTVYTYGHNLGIQFSLFFSEICICRRRSLKQWDEVCVGARVWANAAEYFRHCSWRRILSNERVRCTCWEKDEMMMMVLIKVAVVARDDKKMCKCANCVCSVYLSRSISDSVAVATATRSKWRYRCNWNLETNSEIGETLSA